MNWGTKIEIPFSSFACLNEPVEVAFLTYGSVSTTSSITEGGNVIPIGLESYKVICTTVLHKVTYICLPTQRGIIDQTF